MLNLLQDNAITRVFGTLGLATSVIAISYARKNDLVTERFVRSSIQNDTIPVVLMPLLERSHALFGLD